MDDGARAAAMDDMAGLGAAADSLTVSPTRRGALEQVAADREARVEHVAEQLLAGEHRASETC